MNLLLDTIILVVAVVLASIIGILFRIYVLTKCINEQRRKTQIHINNILNKVKEKKNG